jgi:hypothetical protein
MLYARHESVWQSMIKCPAIVSFTRETSLQGVPKILFRRCGEVDQMGFGISFVSDDPIPSTIGCNPRESLNGSRSGQTSSSRRLLPATDGGSEQHSEHERPRHADIAN